MLRTFTPPCGSNTERGAAGTLSTHARAWLRTGQAVERVLLCATLAGLSTSFVTQTLEWHDPRWPPRAQARPARALVIMAKTAPAVTHPVIQPVAAASVGRTGASVTVPSRSTQISTMVPFGVPVATRATPVHFGPSLSAQLTWAHCRAAPVPSLSVIRRAVTWRRSAAWARAVCVSDLYAASPALSEAVGRPITRTNSSSGGSRNCGRSQGRSN
ncbi:hypothetical protein Z951_11745 [Streptomyces sp. PRh5]|nr:hypothetical protein Z951_11745 [Streptomyces sp. PRh5]